VTHGTYVGFIVGVTESLEYIAYVAAAVLGLGQMLTSLFTTSKKWEPLWWAVFYLTALPVHIRGGVLFWRLIVGCSITIVVIILIYCFGVLPDINFSAYAPIIIMADSSSSGGAADGGGSGSSGYFVGGFVRFMEVLPLTTWWFIGVEALPMACDDSLEVGEWWW